MPGIYGRYTGSNSATDFWHIFQYWHTRNKKRELNGETWVTRKTNVRRGLFRFPATNILLRRLSAYSSSGVLQGHEPPTSATLSVGLTTRPHWGAVCGGVPVARGVMIYNVFFQERKTKNVGPARETHPPVRERGTYDNGHEGLWQIVTTMLNFVTWVQLLNEVTKWRLYKSRH